MQELYELRPDEMERVKSVNAGAKKYIAKCALHGTDEKPSHCQQGPVPGSRPPECGYVFKKDEYGKMTREGECKRCSRCCILPRRDGDPYGFFDPKGKPCKHLIVEEA